MVKMTFQSIINYEVDSDTGNVRVLSKFTTAGKETKAYNKKKAAPVDSKIELGEELM